MLFTLFLVDIVVSWLTEELICLIFLDRCDHNVCTSVVSFPFCLRIKINWANTACISEECLLLLLLSSSGVAGELLSSCAGFSASPSDGILTRRDTNPGALTYRVSSKSDFSVYKPRNLQFVLRVQHSYRSFLITFHYDFACFYYIILQT